MRPFFFSSIRSNYCCCGGFAGGCGTAAPGLELPKPELLPKLELLLKPEPLLEPEENGVDELLLPVWPFKLGWAPNPCSAGWLGVVISAPRSLAGS